jgi:glycosyltransferase involved in cell wall biosynthesis
LFRDGWLRERCEHAGIDTHVLRLSGKLDTSWLRMFARLVRQHDVKLIHAHEFGANTYGAMAARLLGIPLVATVHGRYYYAERATRRWAYRIVSHIATMVAVSEDVKRFLVQVTGTAERRIRVVHNGIGRVAPPPADELDRRRSALGIARGERIVGMVGTLYGVKGHRYLLDAAPQILDACPSTTFVIVGHGPLEAELKAHATRLGLDGRVRFVGFRDNAGELMPLFDVFALPSLSEGLSIALLEALAAGRPVVATNVGGNPELITDGETGLLVPAGDARSLAAAIGRLLTDTAEARRLGGNGMHRVTTRFGLDSMIGGYQAIYERELARAGVGT